MPSLSFRTTMTAPIDEQIHVEVYSVADDGTTTALAPGPDPVDWSDLSDTTTVTPDSAGYNFTSTVVGSDVVTATMGTASASFTLRWVPRTMKFTAAAQPAG